MTSKEARGHKIRPGYWLENIAPLGGDPDWREVVAPHNSGLLFGYEPSDLLAKQYRV